jgi:hypothetical protein
MPVLDERYPSMYKVVNSSIVSEAPNRHTARMLAGGDAKHFRAEQRA